MQEPTFLILTALAGSAQHGYGIMTDVARISRGRVKLRAGTLYAALDRLLGDGTVGVDREEIAAGRLRRYYRLTPAGAELLAAEAERQRQRGDRRHAAAETERGRGASRRHGARRGRGMTGGGALERRYRRLLAWYPAGTAGRFRHLQLPDGSYVSVAADPKVTGKARGQLIEAARAGEDPARDKARLVRVIEYEVPDRDRDGKGELICLITTITEWTQGPAALLAQAYHERWVRHEVAVSERSSRKEDRLMSVT